jgi:hypothetical protein
MTETLKVVDDQIYGYDEKIVNGELIKNNLYMVFWQRIANSGYILCWARDELEAWDRVFKGNPAVRHTIVKIDPWNLPVTDGRTAR